MYEVDGEFGRVRATGRIFSPQAMEKLCCFSSAGWHRCNDRYHIRREENEAQALLLITMAGEGELRLDGESLRLTPGTVGLVRGGVPNEYGTPPGGEWEFYWIHPSGAAAEGLLEYGLPPRGGVMPTQHAVEYGERIEELLRQRFGPPGAGEARAGALVSAIVYRLLEDWEEGTSPRGKERESLSVRVIRYLEEHFTEPVKLEELGRALYLSPTYLIRRFKAESGYTPYEYLTHIRLMRAAEMLSFSDRSVGEVAAAVGFGSVSRFIQQYKRQWGMTPGRQKRGKE